MAEKVLVIDDDPGMLEFLELGLGHAGYTVITAEGGKEGLRQAYETRPDLIILDIMMPELDGWDTCQRLRYACDTPIIMLTARGGQQDVLKGLDMGADDYVVKPFSFEELKARVRTVLRRARLGAPNTWRSIYEDGTLYIDLKQGTVLKRGETVQLTPTESRLLMYLVSQQGRFVPHRELLVNVWGPECANEVGYLSVYIRYLRQKLEDDPSDPHYIRTRWAMGYYFAGEGSLQTID